MISTLENLNNTINDVVNRIVEVSTSHTLSSNYYASYDHVADLISQEDFLKYFDLITEELRGREEVLDLQTTEDHEFDAIYGTNWCPNYENHPDDFAALPVSQPLSMSRKAELLDLLLDKVLAEKEKGNDSLLSEIATLFDATKEELLRMNIPAIEDKALAGSQRNLALPMEFQVRCNGDLKTSQFFPTFEEALYAYKNIPEETKKELSCQTYFRGHVTGDHMLLRSHVFGKEWANDTLDCQDANVRLAAAKAVLYIRPTDPQARATLNQAEGTISAIQKEPSRPIEFQVLTNYDLQTSQVFGTLEEALEAYRNVPLGNPKELYYRTWSYGLIVEDNRLMESRGNGKDFLHTSTMSPNPHVQLAVAKIALMENPNNPLAWSQWIRAEEKVGVTGHVLGENDLQAGNWRVHIIPPKGKYGVNDAVTNDSGKYLVEFYDLRHIEPTFAPNGQFTGARYYADTLLGKDQWNQDVDLSKTGLSLVADVPSWTVSASQMKVILDFVREKADAQRPHPSLVNQVQGAAGRQKEPQQGDEPKDRGRD